MNHKHYQQNPFLQVFEEHRRESTHFCPIQRHAAASLHRRTSSQCRRTRRSPQPDQPKLYTTVLMHPLNRFSPTIGYRRHEPCMASNWKQPSQSSSKHFSSRRRTKWTTGVVLSSFNIYALALIVCLSVQQLQIR